MLTLHKLPFTQFYCHMAQTLFGALYGTKQEAAQQLQGTKQLNKPLHTQGQLWPKASSVSAPLFSSFCSSKCQLGA